MCRECVEKQVVGRHKPDTSPAVGIALATALRKDQLFWPKWPFQCWDMGRDIGRDMGRDMGPVLGKSHRTRKATQQRMP